MDNKEYARNRAIEISKKLKEHMDATGTYQKQLAAGIGTTQGNISKLLDAPENIKLGDFFLMCRELNIQPGSFFQDVIPEYEGLKSTDTIITNPVHTAFKGYLGTYYFYCFHTNSNESGFLKGTFSLERPGSPYKKYCRASLRLYTGKRNHHKDYSGQMAISLVQNTCFCELYSMEYSDYIYMNFEHKFLSSDERKCMIAGCLTTCSGGNKRPVFMKALLTREELAGAQLEELSGVLKMNDKTFRLSENAYEELEDSEHKDLCSFFHIEPMYVSNEALIRGNDAYTTEEKAEKTHFLRKLADTRKYIKISAKSEELLYAYYDSHINNKV